MAEGKQITVSVRMAKATDADMDAAYDMANLLSELGKGYYPRRNGDDDAPTFFDSDDREHLEYLHQRILEIEDRGSLFRVVGGMSTLLHAPNQIVDPDSDCIELHPKLRRALKVSAAGDELFAAHVEREEAESNFATCRTEFEHSLLRDTHKSPERAEARRKQNAAILRRNAAIERLNAALAKYKEASA